MWIKDNITRTGKEVFYEAELIEEIKEICKAKRYDFNVGTGKNDFFKWGMSTMALRILDLIESYEGER